MTTLKKSWYNAAVCYYTFPYPSWLDFRTHAYPYILAGLSLGVVVDCLITLAVSRQLIKGRTGISEYVTKLQPVGRLLTRPLFSTDVLLKRLLGYTLNTGFITSYVLLANDPLRIRTMCSLLLSKIICDHWNHHIRHLTSYVGIPFLCVCTEQM
jgi:hypothetical protein